MSVYKKVLIIDDEAPIRKFLRISLEIGGYHILEAKNGTEGLSSAITTKPDVVILDLGLPDMDGKEVLKKIREWSQIPIIVLTVLDAEESKVAALDLGADDYLTKPFSVPELMARLRATERRAHTDQPAIFTSGPLNVDLAGRIVTVANREVHLTATEYNLLTLLIRHAGKILTHRHILSAVWGPNATEHTQYLRVYMGHLRKKLESGPDAKKIIITEPGVGYRLLVL